MRSVFQRISVLFAAGCFGGLLNSLVVWGAGRQGLTQTLGVKIAPALTPAWLYPRLVWGGIWGVLFLLPVLSRSPLSKGLLLSLGPTLAQLLWVFPLKAHKGYWGLELGVLTPAFVLFFNAVWGIAAGYWLKWSRSN